MFVEILKYTLMITGFVMVMMLIIEYINVRSSGRWSKPLQKNKWLQILVAAVLGIIPGCLGTYTVVSLFTHNIVGFGALVTTMIATSGDEAFVMFGLMPGVALKLTLIIFFIAIATGAIITLIPSKKSKQKVAHFEVHEHEDECKCYHTKDIIAHFKNITFYRAILLFGLALFIFGVASGELGHSHNNEIAPTKIETEHLHDNDMEHEHEEASVAEVDHDHTEHEGEWNWISITFLIVSAIALFIIATVPNHFLQHHLWEHIIKVHFLKILLWTFGALLFIALLKEYVDIEHWVSTNQIYIILFAVLIGIIPESGPHLVFVTMFFSGTIPFSILLANSIVQDGHGALPLFAESKKSFLKMKLINVIVGLIVGFAGYYFQF